MFMSPCAVPSIALALAIGFAATFPAEARPDTALRIASDEIEFPCEGGQCTAYEVTATKERIDAVAELEKSFVSRVGSGRLVECSIILSEPFGHSFSARGALCNVVLEGKRFEWMVCDDDGVGNFAAVTGARWRQDRRTYLARFTRSNCVGG
jgi:hypothetical protein